MQLDERKWDTNSIDKLGEVTEKEKLTIFQLQCNQMKENEILTALINWVRQLKKKSQLTSIFKNIFLLKRISMVWNKEEFHLRKASKNKDIKHSSIGRILFLKRKYIHKQQVERRNMQQKCKNQGGPSAFNV